MKVRTTRPLVLEGQRVCERERVMSAEDAGAAILEVFRSNRAVKIQGDIVTPQRWITLSLRRAVLNANQRYSTAEAAERLVNAAIAEGLMVRIPEPVDPEAQAAAEAERLEAEEAERLRLEEEEAARQEAERLEAERLEAEAQAAAEAGEPGAPEGETETSTPGQEGKGAPENKGPGNPENKGGKATQKKG